MSARRTQHVAFGVLFCILVATWCYFPSKSLRSIDSKVLNPTKIALLMETRPLTYMPDLLSHFMSVLEPDWTFRFVGSTEAIALITASTSLLQHIKSGKLYIIELPVRYHITTQEDISITFTSLDFYTDFLAPAEWLLVFQADSMICAASEYSINDWIRENYTWLGAPWDLNVKGGNGGLSLRHVPDIIKLLEKEQRKEGSDWEDTWLCGRLTNSYWANMPDPYIALDFSVEGIYTEKPYGFHLLGLATGSLVSHIWGNESRRMDIMNYCPEVSMLLDNWSGGYNQ